MDLPPMTVVETPFFLRKASSLLDEEARSELVVFLGMNPESGNIIPETGGVRKLRWTVPGRGKRGGIRVIYKYRNEKFPLFLLTVYAKNQKANLTKAERNAWNNLVPVLVATYAKKRPI
jgi:mRNA-degrading endonuclease RelE of RelBE toxin-antitoxin system